jgi:hypothetical protein
MGVFDSIDHFGKLRLDVRQWQRFRHDHDCSHHDPEAFAQVALWGTICSLITLGAWGLSRWTRRNWVGALVGIGPLLVTLYFFFENVNRLLPDGL